MTATVQIVVVALRIEPGGTTRTVIVECPYCGAEHAHGWPYGDAGDPGSRVAHCHRGEYRIEVPR